MRMQRSPQEELFDELEMRATAIKLDKLLTTMTNKINREGHSNNNLYLQGAQQPSGLRKKRLTMEFNGVSVSPLKQYQHRYLWYKNDQLITSPKLHNHFTTIIEFFVKNCNSFFVIQFRRNIDKHALFLGHK